MRRLVGASLRFRWLVIFAAAAVTALGIASIPDTKVDVFPEFAPPRVEIQTLALGNSSNEVEELITVPIEDERDRRELGDRLGAELVETGHAGELLLDRHGDELLDLVRRVAQR